MAISVSVVGASGFSGIELLKLIATRPELELASTFSDRWKGARLADVIPELRGRGGIERVVVRPQSESTASGEAAIAIFATPAETSAELAPHCIAKGARVLDLSGAFRLPDTDVFRAYYGFAHPEPALLAEAHYGLPDVPRAAGDAPPITKARLVANPGCYATAAILPNAALLAKKLIQPKNVFLDGKSGITGAGRKVAERYLFNEISENLAPYKVAKHQHTPEIELALSRVAGEDVRVTFAPHLVPIRRGLIVTSFGMLTRDVPVGTLEAALREAYASNGSALGPSVVEVADVDTIETQSVWGTPFAKLGAREDVARGSWVATCAIDNLMKGAASQAIENVLRMIG